MEEIKKIRVAIVEDEKHIQQYLEKMIREDLVDSCEFDFAVSSVQEFLEGDKPNEYNPDVVLLDMHLGEGNPSGMAIVDFFRKRKKNIPKILVISTYLNEFVVEMNKQSGIVRGCIKKSVILMNGSAFLETQLKRAVNPEDEEFIVFLESVPEPEPLQMPVAPIVKERKPRYVKILPNKITGIQQRVLVGLAQGETYIDIAKALNKNVSTIRVHGKRLRYKLGVETTVQLLSKAQELGFLKA